MNELQSSSLAELEKAAKDDNMSIACLEGEVEKPIVGLEDGGDITVNCRGCNKELMTIVQVRKEPLVLKLSRNEVVSIPQQRFQANCPYCNSKSWIVVVKGHSVCSGIL